MTYDIRDTMIDRLSKFEILLEGFVYHVQRKNAERITDVVLDMVDRHLASEPRTKAETALIEFAEGKARAMRDNGFLWGSLAIPSEILQAFVEELE